MLLIFLAVDLKIIKTLDYFLVGIEEKKFNNILTFMKVMEIKKNTLITKYDKEKSKNKIKMVSIYNILYGGSNF